MTDSRSQVPASATGNSQLELPNGAASGINRAPSVRSSHSSIHSSESANLLRAIEASTSLPAPQRTSWWWWNGQETGPVEVQDIQPSMGVDATASWGEYFTSYKNTVVGYVYYKESNDPLETTPLMSASETPRAQQDALWFKWLWWSTVPEEEESYEEYTNNVELYKSAKVAIETSKDSICYGYKGGFNSQFLVYDHELSVSGTPSEYQPVKYNIKKTPITPSEIQENTLQVIVTANATSPNKTPQLGSSSSSIKSNLVPELDLGTIKVNQIVPDINHNFRTITWITFLRLFGEKLLFQHNTSENHLYMLKDRDIMTNKLYKMKRVVIISVHSFLPTKFVRSMVGLASGNSIKLVEEATRAVELWLNSNKQAGYENMYNIDTIALEGQGTIEERVEKSMNLLENWKDVINECDFLYVVGHSHGAVIGIQLLSQLLQDSKYNIHHKKLGLLSMAGPLNGAVKSLESKIVIRAYTPIENKVLSELVQLLNPASPESTKLQQAFNTLVTSNVKITLSGSIDDQLVPLNSALANDFYHPNIFRCIYVDKDTTVPKFICTLWNLILISRNIGHLEHGITGDISEKCSGTVAEGGHNKIYNDGKIYETSIKFALETTLVKQNRPLKVITSTYDATTATYKLPWTVRELVQDILQTKHIISYELVQQLVESYHQWDDSRHWKDVKNSLEAIGQTDYEDLIM